MTDVFDHNPEPILVVNRKGYVLRANPAAQALNLTPGTDLMLGRRDLASVVAAAYELEPGADLTARLDANEGPLNLDRVHIHAQDDDSLWVFLRVQSPEEVAGRLVRRMVAHTPGAGQTYFEQLVVNLAQKLGTRFAMVGALDPATQRIRSLALCDSGHLSENLTYPVAGSPCEGVIRHGPSFYPAHAAKLFPDDPMLVDEKIEAYVGVPLLGRDGDAIGLLMLMHDEPIDSAANPAAFLNLFAGRTATEVSRVQAELEATRQRTFAEQLLDQVGALVLLLRSDGKVVRANRTVEFATGWSEQVLRGRNLWRTVTPNRRADAHAGTSSGRTRSVEEDWYTPEGQTRRVRWEAVHIHDPGRHETYILVTGVDLTALASAREERDRLQEHLRQARRLEALGRLAGGVAHDFNNLLLAILGYADLVEMEADPDSDIGSFAAEIRRAGDQAAGLTRQLLAFGRRQRLERRQLDLIEVVDSASRILKPLLPSGVELELDLPDIALPVVADPGRLETVVVNLGVNARDAMPNGGLIHITARTVEASELPLGSPLGRAVIVEVSDTGTGIPDDVLPHIFEPFFTTKELGRGTGLGLASVYGTVQQHGGTVDVGTSDGGTTFRIVLPLAGLHGEDAPENARRATPASRGRILVAEDDPHVRSLVTRVLANAGYSVDAHADGQAALEAVHGQSTEYDLVLADVLMPRLGGIELCQKLLERDPNARVVLTSGFVAESDLVPPGVRLVQKPYLPDDLLQEISKALQA